MGVITNIIWIVRLRTAVQEVPMEFLEFSTERKHFMRISDIQNVCLQVYNSQKVRYSQ